MGSRIKTSSNETRAECGFDCSVGCFTRGHKVVKMGQFKALDVAGKLPTTL